MKPLPTSPKGRRKRASLSLNFSKEREQEKKIRD